MPDYIYYLQSLKYPSYRNKGKLRRGYCFACGKAGAEFTYFEVINQRLKDEWKISRSLQIAFSERESMHCDSCRSSLRLRELSRAISLVYSQGSKSLVELVKDPKFRRLNIAEINACGDLHNILKTLPNIKYSEYESDDKNTRGEDLQALSYENNFFDLVLTSDTLEHIPDYKTAINEILRILKPGGYHIFTIPIVFSRKTKRRVKLEGNSVVPILDASYHGAGEPGNLVSSEFGIDLLKELRDSNIDIKVYFAHPFRLNYTNCVLITQKPSK